IIAALHRVLRLQPDGILGGAHAFDRVQWVMGEHIDHALPGAGHLTPEVLGKVGDGVPYTAARRRRRGADEVPERLPGLRLHEVTEALTVGHYWITNPSASAAFRASASLILCFW